MFSPVVLREGIDAPRDEKVLDFLGAHLMGGAVYEYFPTSRSGLLSYICVRPQFRQRHAAQQLLQAAVKLVEDCAVLHARREGRDRTPVTSYFFAETNAEGVEDGVMTSRMRHRIMQKLGFCMVDFAYIQPPLSEEQSPCSELLLLVYSPPSEVPFGESLLPPLLNCLVLSCLVIWHASHETTTTTSLCVEGFETTTNQTHPSANVFSPSLCAAFDGDSHRGHPIVYGRILRIHHPVAAT